MDIDGLLDALEQVEFRDAESGRCFKAIAAGNGNEGIVVTIVPVS